MSSRAILRPRNETVDIINDHVLVLNTKDIQDIEPELKNPKLLAMFSGDTMTCFSVDSVAKVDQQAVCQTECLNSLTLSGLPTHKLGINAPIMLLQNMAPSRGHCNGTRYIVLQISRQYFTSETVCGE